MATHSSILVWRIPGQRSLVGYSPWVPKELDMTKQLTFILIAHQLGNNKINIGFVCVHIGLCVCMCSVVSDCLQPHRL